MATGARGNSRAPSYIWYSYRLSGGGARLWDHASNQRTLIRSRSPVSTFVVAAAAGIGVAVAPPRVGAQRSLAPTVGVYIPTSELVKAASGDEFKQEVSITVGGRLGFTFGSRGGLEATVAYAPSKLRFSSTGSDIHLGVGVGIPLLGLGSGGGEGGR